MEQSGIYDIYKKLYRQYGPQNWWPAIDPYEVAVGAVLTQNTAWTNVEKAIAGFKGKLSPEMVISLSHDELVDIIRPAGYYNSKAKCLFRLTEWYMDYAKKDKNEKGLSQIREELLAIKGIGKETADSILLYALNLPVFVIDAYTRQLFERLGYTVPKQYDDMRSAFEGALPVKAEIYNEYHALIVTHCKNACRKKPLCEDCIFINRCRYT